MTTTAILRHRGNWIAGVVVGVAAGVLSLIFPTLGWLLAVAFLVGLIRATPRMPAIGGLFLGFGVAWLVILVRSHLECQAFGAVPGQECGEPDIGSWLAVAGILLAIGVLLTVVAWTRASRRG
jgi:uncharacterized membrane protein